MNKTYVVGNWKMNGSLDLVKDFNRLKSVDQNVKIVICPPYPYLPLCSKQSRSYSFGAQNCHHSLSGSYTGEVSVGQLAEIGCEYVIVGHSERRIMFQETNSNVNNKARLAQSKGLIPIVCVGEPIDIRKDGTYKKYVLDQLERSLVDLNLTNTIVAYEPIWAIGTGIVPTNSEIEEIAQLIKSNFNGVHVLYGGSVKSENIEVLKYIDNLDGFLVGGASLDLDSFQKIVDSFSK